MPEEGPSVTTAIDPVPLATGRPVIFYAPHQDDETLFMGQVIAHHALAGRDVHVVLGSDGSTSRIRNALNGLEGNAWWGGSHYPEREFYSTLSTADFAAARDRELVAACGQLGVQPGNIHLELGTRGPTIDVPGAEALIRRYDDLYPDAGHYSMWWGDGDPTHKALGTALRNLAVSEPGTFNDCRWMVRTDQIASSGSVPYALPATTAATIQRMARRAGWAYRSWAPQQGLFAIGYHSVGPSYFDEVERGDALHIVKSP